MPKEIELKLELPSRADLQPEQLPWLRRHASGEAKREKLVSVYFDTPDTRLHDHGLTLRIRREGDRRIQTIKSAQANGVFARGEWETPVKGAEPDLRKARKSALKPLLKPRLARALTPLFETVIERTAIPVEIAGSSVEIAIDHGQIRTTSRRSAVNEIEIELKEGDPTVLAEVARRLADDLPLTVGMKSKSERGYALCAGESLAPAFRGDIAFGKKSTTEDGLKTIALSCLRHWASNREAVLHRDPEGIHQMRVGLRRFRAALSVFKILLHDPGTEALKRDLKWLTEQLGPARDFDVFLNETVKPLSRQSADKPELSVLAADLEDRRSAGLEKAIAAVQSDRYRQVLLRAALWTIAGRWSASRTALRRTRRSRRLASFAREALARRARKIIRKLKKIEDLDDRKRHKLRIAVKKLRYTVEFFASLFPGRKARAQRRAFEKKLKVLQDALGKLNDIRVHQGFARSLSRPGRAVVRPVDKALAVGFVTGRETAATDEILRDIRRSAKALSRAPQFWR